MYVCVMTSSSSGMFAGHQLSSHFPHCFSASAGGFAGASSSSDDDSDEENERGKAASMGRKAQKAGHSGGGKKLTQSKAEREALLFGGVQVSGHGENVSKSSRKKKKKRRRQAEAALAE